MSIMSAASDNESNTIQFEELLLGDNDEEVVLLEEDWCEVNEPKEDERKASYDSSGDNDCKQEELVSDEKSANLVSERIHGIYLFVFLVILASVLALSFTPYYYFNKRLPCTRDDPLPDNFVKNDNPQETAVLLEVDNCMVRAKLSFQLGECSSTYFTQFQTAAKRLVYGESSSDDSCDTNNFKDWVIESIHNTSYDILDSVQNIWSKASFSHLWTSASHEGTTSEEKFYENPMRNYKQDTNSNNCFSSNRTDTTNADNNNASSIFDDHVVDDITIIVKSAVDWLTNYTTDSWIEAAKNVTKLFKDAIIEEASQEEDVLFTEITQLAYESLTNVWESTKEAALLLINYGAVDDATHEM